MKSDHSTKNNNHVNELPNKGRDMQGIEKAQGEEPAENTKNVTWESQKGKKVDGDPSKKSDQPIDHQ